ncbi:hypothetical protein EDB86DRAFT_3089671 [Lactarius hatsudake]|nr:hypothetical protein EDB86DRAFT_3089671 [Lactarius hatsudake]
MLLGSGTERADFVSVAELFGHLASIEYIIGGLVVPRHGTLAVHAKRIRLVVGGSLRKSDKYTLAWPSFRWLMDVVGGSARADFLLALVLRPWLDLSHNILYLVNVNDILVFGQILNRTLKAPFLDKEPQEVDKPVQSVWASV